MKLKEKEKLVAEIRAMASPNKRSRKVKKSGK
jgi:hypothetical protein